VLPVYAVQMVRYRPFLVLVFAMAVLIQPGAAALCACEIAGDAAAHDTAHMSDSGLGHHPSGHSPDMTTDMTEPAGSEDCEQTHADCECGVCASSVGVVFQAMASFDFAVPIEPIVTAAYTEPPEEQAFRPPIPS
jgi:hypothetical protein